MTENIIMGGGGRKIYIFIFLLRTDDNEESLRKRFVTYESATMPIIRLFYSCINCVY